MSSRSKTIGFIPGEMKAMRDKERAVRANDAALLRKTDESEISNPHPHEMRLSKARKLELRQGKKKSNPVKRHSVIERLGKLIQESTGSFPIPATLAGNEWIASGELHESS